MTPKGEPIMIRCEGSGSLANIPKGGLGYCQMCGRVSALLPGDTMPEHQRDDIIARINRGDFG